MSTINGDYVKKMIFLLVLSYIHPHTTPEKMFAFTLYVYYVKISISRNIVEVLFIEI